MNSPKPSEYTTFGKDYFEGIYRDYSAQNPPRKFRRHTEFIQRFAPGRIPLRLLDIGCGPGGFLRHLVATEPDAWTLHATDVSDYAIALLAADLPGVHIHKAAADQKVLPEGSLDIVTALDVIEHVPDLTAVAAAVGSMLADDGIFIFVVPVYDGPLGALVRLLDRDPSHIHKEARNYWLRWAAENFEIIDWVGVIRFLFPFRLYLQMTGMPLRRLGSAIIVAARKRML